MANPDIPAALVVIEAHLTAAGAALVVPITDVARGLPFAIGRQIRVYWSGECEPPHMGGADVLNGQEVGQRFAIQALWPIPVLTKTPKIGIDTEMQLLATEVRTRINADKQLGGNVTDLDLGYAEPDVVPIVGVNHISLTWQLDLAYVEYPVSA